MADDTPETGPMESSVRESLEAMKWVELSDRATVHLALTYARQMDEFLASDNFQLRSKGIYIGPHLLRALAELGGTPTVRLQHELRSLKLLGKVAEGGGDGDEDGKPAEKPAGSVTSLQRPPKRGRSA